MKKFGALRWTILGVVVGLAAGGAVSWAAIPSSPGNALTACYPTSGPSKGVLRVIDYQAGQRCASGEATVAWPQKDVCSGYPHQGVDWSMPGSTIANGCDFTAANLDKQVLVFANLTNAQLTSAILTESNMYGASAAGANFHFADLTGANLMTANLSKASLGQARLRNAMISGANLTGAGLSGAQLDGVVGLESAQLRTAAKWPTPTQCGNATGVLLAGTAFDGLNLTGFDMSNFNLFGAHLDATTLSGANLTHARLRGALMSSAELSQVNFTCADLTGAVTTGATFTAAIWNNTLCPDATNSNDHGNTCAGHL